MMVWFIFGCDLHRMERQHRGTSTGIGCATANRKWGSALDVMTVRSRVSSQSIRSGKFRTIINLFEKYIVHDNTMIQ